MAGSHSKLHASEHLSGGIDELTGINANQISNGIVSNTEFDYLDGLTGEAASKDYVDSKVQGLDWNESVIDKNVSDPSTLTPSEGDRYIVAGSASGDWSGREYEIAEYDGSSWVFTTPDEGFAVWVEDEDVQYVYAEPWSDGVDNWVTLSSTQDHSNLSGLGDDDHTQYLLVNGSRAMSGSLDMGTYGITNVGDVDGVDVGSHDHTTNTPTVPNSGLTNSSVTVAGNSVSLGGSTSVAHADLSDAPTDAHHAGFVGLMDNSGDTVNPDGSYLIQFTDDTKVNADAGTNQIDLSLTESNIVHDNLSGGTTSDAHHAKTGDDEVYGLIRYQTGSPANTDEAVYVDSDGGDALFVYDGGSSSWVQVSDKGSGADQLSDLSDVSSVSYTDGDVLRADGSGYVTSTLTHGDLASVTYNDHHGVGNAIEWDGSNNIAVTSNGIGTGEIDESISPTWTGTHDYSGATVLPPMYSQTSEPTITNNSVAIWEDTSSGGGNWILVDIAGAQFKVEVT